MSRHKNIFFFSHNCHFCVLCYFQSAFARILIFSLFIAYTKKTISKTFRQTISSLQKLSDSPMESVQEPSEDGLLKEKSGVVEPSEETTSTTNTTSTQTSSQTTPSKKRKLSTQESPRNIKRKILKDKSKTYNDNTQTISSSKTSPQESIGTGKVLKPFWNKRSKELSVKSSYPTRIDWHELDMNSWNGSFPNSRSKLSFSMKQTATNPLNKTCPTTSLPLLDLMSQGTTGKEQPPTKDDAKKCKKMTQNQKMKKNQKKKSKDPVTRTLKIRLYPNNEQKQKLRQWHGASRWIYNECLMQCKEDSRNRNIETLRQKVTNKSAIKDENKWLHNVPAAVREGAAFDYLKAVDSNLAKSNQHKFEIRLRSKKKGKQESFVLNRQNWSYKSGKYHFLHEIHTTEPKPGYEDIKYDCRVVHVKALDEYYLTIPMSEHDWEQWKRPKSSNSTIESQDVRMERPRRKVVSLDPGVRTFMTGYDAEEGQFIKLGTGDIAQVQYLCWRMDKLQSKLDTEKPNARRRRRMKLALARMRKRISNTVDNIHYHFVKFLCSNYEEILLPVFKTQKMCKKERRKLNSKTARNMLTWKHYRFQQRLLAKGKSTNTKVRIVTEEFTTQTCGQCGKLSGNLKGAKMYKCKKCNFVMDRDANGARNIFLLYRSTRAATPSWV